MKNKLINKIAHLISCVAFIIAVSNVNSTCTAIIHQAPIPDCVWKYQKNDSRTFNKNR